MAKLGDLITPGGGVKESRAASKAYIPGYDAQPLDSGTDAASTRELTIEGDFTVPSAAPDLKFSSLESLISYAKLNSEESQPFNVIAGELPVDATGLPASSPLSVPESGFLQDFALSGLHITRNSSAGPEKDGDLHPTISGHTPIKPEDEPDRGLHFLSKALRDLGLSPDDISGNQVSSFGSKLDPSKPTVGGKGDIKFDVIQNLIQSNRFSPGTSSPFLLHESADSPAGEARLTNGLFSLQTGLLGKFDKNRKGVTVEILRKAAIETLLKAQSIGEDRAAETAKKIFSSGNPYSESNMLYLIPHLTQIGASMIGIDGLRIRSAKVLDTFAGDAGVQARGADDLITLESYAQGIFQTGKDDESTKGVSKNAKTHGTMNSPSEQFGGVAPFGMVLPAFYGIIVFGILGLGIGAAIAALANVGGRAPSKNPESPWTYPYGGNYNGSDADIGEKFLKMFGMTRETPTEFTSLAAGMMLYYGISHNPFMPTGESVVESLINLLIGPGFYVVVGKRILQDFAQVTEAFANYTNIGAGGFQVFAMFTIILSSIEALMSSFTMRFFLVMNSLGRIVELSTGNPGLHGHSGNIIRLSEQSKEKSLTPENRNKMSRYHAGDSSVRGTLSMHLFDSLWKTPLDGNQLGVGGVEAPSSLVGARQMLPIGARRFSLEEVKWVEDKINAEYVPFSFQDLRTNEVISLPAFIQSLSDDFNANYNSTHGYGRTDPVYSYSKTTRQISLSFVMIAMNEPDHHYLWATVNKLVSMVYPQRDAGQLREDDENKIIFAQPFSQRIAASPVIRIRLGDVLKSNKSFESMKKLFGGSSVISLNEEGKKANELYKKRWTDNEETSRLADLGLRTAATLAHCILESSLSGHSVLVADEDIIDINEVIDKVGELYLMQGATLKSPKKKHFNMTSKYPVKITDLKAISEEQGAPPEGAGEGSGKPTAPLKSVEFTVELADELEAYAFGGNPALQAFREVNGFPPEIKLPPPFPPEPPKVTFSMNALEASRMIKIVDDLAAGQGLYDTEKEAGFTAYLRGYVLGKNAYKELASEGMEAQIEDLAVSISAAIQKFSEDRTITIQQLLDPEQNAVVRSFNSTHGTGLAGVITQLGLDYMDSPWGTTPEVGTESNLRAPKMVRVQLSFSPIHDMPLGLNDAGDEFAPAYPVGRISGPPPGDVGTDFSETNNMTLKLEQEKLKARIAASLLPETKNFGKPELPF